MANQNTNSCQIFGIVGIIVQLFLGALSFSVLVLKRYHEHPKRPWRIWAMDTSKQGVSQLIAHFINVGISLLLSNHLDNDACIWYFTTNVLDNTVGVFFCCGVLRLIQRFILAGRWDQFKSGNYYDIVEYDEDSIYKAYTYYKDQSDDDGKYRRQSNITTSSHYTQNKQNNDENTIKSLQICTKKQIILISYFAWVIQFLIWNLIVAVCKSILFTIELLLNKPLNAVGQFLLGWVQPYQTGQLILVIIIIPVIMNGLAFWIQDNFLKKSDENETSQRIKQPLI